MADTGKIYQLPYMNSLYADNYIYLYHTDTIIWLPEYADSINDSIQVNYSNSTPLSRTAPIYSWSSSGPRSLSAQFSLHRDMMMELNYNRSNAPLGMNEDYIDVLIKQLQAAALPRLDTSMKLIDPPLVAMRLGSDIFIKGIVNGSIGVTYKFPLISAIDKNGNAIEGSHRYSNVDISISIYEVEPYYADDVMTMGSYRGLSTSLQGKVMKLVGGNSSSGYSGGWGGIGAST